jgi:hypothetical protein
LQRENPIHRKNLENPTHQKIGKNQPLIKLENILFFQIFPLIRKIKYKKEEKGIKFSPSTILFFYYLKREKSK